ncbi:hypothetical protein [Pseudomonas canadensis]|uniref:hypothetical protein n=1 Tax=Pseudomonas canadensis TaxID=915099 RepID=UPI001F355CCF|nr:hypothetical protein [Pseudomonas canadensis]MCF5167926.1 hypothetical protein [Pseudomonas canadensis]
MVKIRRANLAYYKENIEKANFSIKIEHTNPLYQNLIDAQKKILFMRQAKKKKQK